MNNQKGTNRVLQKTYCKIEFKLSSPLSVGSGKNDFTDKDIIKKRNKVPYIPGSAIAGVCRNSLKCLSEQDQEKYFGFVQINESTSGENINKKANTSENSRVIFYDACVIKEDIEKCFVTKRDFVALDEYKCALTGKKYDIEILEPGIRMVTYVEQNYYSENELDIVDLIEKAWMNHGISFGSKTMRGLGEVDVVKIQKINFNLRKTEEVDSWIEFDMYDENSWKAVEPQNNYEQATTAKDEMMIKLELVQNSGISIRRYTSEVTKGKVQPDYEQLTVYSNTKNPIPVVPGSSWAGAFRHHMSQWLNKDQIEDLFGYADKKRKRISKISFSESQLKGAKEKIFSRNAIDRFSGGTVDTALYTEKTYYGGETVLCIKIIGTVCENQKRALSAAITDLHMGFLAVGGETSIGRGLFNINNVRIDKCNDKTELSEINDTTLYYDLIGAMDNSGVR